MHESTHFLTVIKDNNVLKYCGEVLGTLKATSNNIIKLEDLENIPAYTKFNGVLIDLHSLFKLSTLDRAFLKLYASSLPILKFVWNVKNNSMMITQITLDGSDINDLPAFVEKCKFLPASAIRRERRYSTLLNASLGTELVNINNISKHGCFVLTTMNSFQLGDEISMTIKEFSDETPISCIIHRRVAWGSSMHAAGIGVEFLSLTDAQQSQLEILLTECAQSMERDLEMVY